MGRLCVKTETWIVYAQIDAGELPPFDENLAAWFQQEYEWPALYAEEGGQG